MTDAPPLQPSRSRRFITCSARNHHRLISGMIPLPFDLIAIDEASMIDLALMSKRVDALKPDARLILLGDKDQLASVEAGAVLADLTASLPAQTMELRKAHRFQGEIKALAEAINRQQGELAWGLLQDESSATAMLAENNAAMQLYNGDIGTCLSDPGLGQLRVCFLRPDGSIKSLLPGRLPRCETVYAMTIRVWGRNLRAFYCCCQTSSTRC